MSIMRIIAVTSIPFLMLSDYFFTLLGKKLRDNIYAQHICTEQYELNPVWQDEVNKMKKFNYKHLLAIILVTGYFYFTAKLLSDPWFDIIYGALFAIYVYVMMRHLNNILIYKFANKNPGQISGKAVLGHILVLKISEYQVFTAAIFLFLIFLWTRSWFVLGCSFGLLILTLKQIRWISAYKKKMKLKAQTVQTQESQAQLPS